MDIETRETTDARGRVVEATRSLTKWFEREVAVVNRAISIGREQLAFNPDDTETQASVSELERQREDLYAGWRNSSVRRHVESRGGQQSAAAGDREQRITLNAGSGSSLAAGGRATQTGSNVTATAIVGYGAIFNKEADIGYFREKIQPGAFAEVIKQSDCRCLFNHDADHLFGRESAGTLELAEDSVGLKFVCHLLRFDGPSYALARRIDRRDIQGCSFSFTVAKDRWELARKPGDIDLRIIEQIDQLFDVGPVTYPAYPQTSVQAIFEEVPRSARTVNDGDEYGAPAPRPGPARRERTISPARQQILARQLAAVEANLHEWDVNHVEGLLADLDRRRAVDRKRQAHLAVHPEDAGRLDIPGGLLLAGRG